MINKPTYRIELIPYVVKKCKLHEIPRSSITQEAQHAACTKYYNDQFSVYNKHVTNQTVYNTHFHPKKPITKLM